MNLPRWIFPGFREWLAKQKTTRHRFFQITNLTRETVIATNVEIADTGAKRNRGLLGRNGLAAGDGLWIVPCQSVHTFGMQFSIDLIYLDSNHKIRKIRSSVSPWRVSICLSAQSVVELPAGTVRETQTRPGDFLEIKDAVTSGINGHGSAVLP
jgi:uncharacterized protein